jgi:(4S)-4-hydroxy-5-phosphonooxypentane-2,3-dione isomerase
MEDFMYIVLVHIRVKAEYLEEFIKASLENARNSIKEPGIARFDVIQEIDDPTKFLLVEVYRNMDAPVKHKETPHYLRWRDTVADMLSEPRFGVKYQNVFPADENW